MSSLGSNLLLKDNLLTIKIKEPFFHIKKMALGVTSEKSTFEPAKRRRKTIKKTIKCPVWGG